MELFTSCAGDVEPGKAVGPAKLTGPEQQELEQVKQFLRPRLAKQVAYSGQTLNEALFQAAALQAYENGWKREVLEKAETALKQALLTCQPITDWIWYNFDQSDTSLFAFGDYEVFPQISYMGNIFVNLAVKINQETINFLPFIAQHESRHVKERLFFHRLYPETMSRSGGNFVFDRQLYQARIRDFFAAKAALAYDQGKASYLISLYDKFLDSYYPTVMNIFPEVRVWAQGREQADRETFLHMLKLFIRTYSSSDSMSYANLEKVFSGRTANAAFFALLAEKYGYTEIAANIKRVFVEDSLWSFLSDRFSPPKFFKKHYDLFAAQWEISQRFIAF